MAATKPLWGLLGVLFSGSSSRFAGGLKGRRTTDKAVVNKAAVQAARYRYAVDYRRCMGVSTPVKAIIHPPKKQKALLADVCCQLTGLFCFNVRAGGFEPPHP